MSKILYAGDSAIKAVLGIEGMEIFSLMDEVWDAGVTLQNALEQAGHSVTRMLSHEAYHHLPETAEQFAAFDVVILSDIGHDTVLLYPGARRNAVPMGPNRMKEIVRYVQNGGGLFYIGGYFTYQGHNGQGRWYGTPVAKILPVEILPLPDDRIEAPEGAHVQVLLPNHPILSGIPLDGLPIFMGYNKTAPSGGELLAVIGEEKDPFLACAKVGRGRVVALTSDCAPHWGSDMVRWPHYRQFVDQVIRWLVGGLG
ncbi:MAG: glutamine amidotransferase [Chloroflexi bacterium]|nr:glutamine amidotransferase [Chloroflexota bacterium]